MSIFCGKIHASSSFQKYSYPPTALSYLATEQSFPLFLLFYQSILLSLFLITFFHHRSFYPFPLSVSLIRFYQLLTCLLNHYIFSLKLKYQESEFWLIFISYCKALIHFISALGKFYPLKDLFRLSFPVFIASCLDFVSLSHSKVCLFHHSLNLSSTAIRSVLFGTFHLDHPSSSLNSLSQN